MTDNEIIKALEDCFDKNEIVVSVYEPNDTKTDVTIQDVLDLINRQKAKIDGLQEQYKLAVEERVANVKGFTETLKTAKADAIKSFAAKLLNRINGKYTTTIYLMMLGEIDNLVKETVGENNARFSSKNKDGG